VNRFFRDSHEALLLNILRDDDINDTEVKRLREMLRVDSPDNKDGQR
jgi:predicted transcriptional regulator